MPSPRDGLARPPHAARLIQRMDAPQSAPQQQSVPLEHEPVRVLVFDRTLDKGDPVYNCRFIEPSLEDGCFVRGAGDIAEVIAGLKQVGRPIRLLTLCGHGYYGILGMGSGTSGDYQKGKDVCVDELGDIQEALSELQPLLCPGAIVLLVGCHVGAKASGKRLLRQLSAVLPGCLVLASEAYLQPAHAGKSFWVNQVGVLNAKKGAHVKLVDLVGAIDGRAVEDVCRSLSERDFLLLVDWPAGKKARTHTDTLKH